MFGLETLAPRFLVPSKRINVLYEPKDFYGYVCNKIRTARSRVFLASLYVGKTEQDLIDVIADALHKNDELQVYVLVDGLRGTREAPKTSSASLLAPLAKQYPSRVQLSLYRTPKLGFFSSRLPKRIIEGVGLQHMKLYGWDDEILLSGANLSSDYFTNRQDRYISIQDRSVADYFFRVYSSVAKFSDRLLPADNEQKFTFSPATKYEKRLAREELRVLLQPSVNDHRASISIEKNSDRDQKDSAASNEPTTEVYPVGQLTPLKLGNEHRAMMALLSTLKTRKYEYMLTAGYFNVEKRLARELSQAPRGDVIVASPQANGFYKSKGISGKLPHFYSLLTKNFMNMIPPDSGVNVHEWRRGTVYTPGGWSYHAKGIWMWEIADEKKLPFVTYIGSSNFTQRSYNHDLECGAVLVTDPENRDDPLRRQLAAECDNLQKHAPQTLNPATFDPQSSIQDRLLLLLFGSRL